MAVSINRRLLLDRIRFVVLVNSQHFHSAASMQLQEMSEMSPEVLPGGKITCVTFLDKHKIKQVRMSYRPDGKRTIACIQVGRTPSMKRCFSLELYPSMFQEGEFLKFQELIAALLNEFNYEKLYATANVTYVEFAIDSLTEKMGELLPVLAKSTCSYVYPLEDKTGGHYVGATTGDRFVIYDKRRQLVEEYKIVPEYETQTRIEARLRSLGMTAADIPAKLKNPFLKLELAHTAKLLTLLTEPKYGSFLSQVQESGMSAALHCYPPKDRRVLLKKLRKSNLWWWKPHLYWKRLPEAMAVIKPAPLFS